MWLTAQQRYYFKKKKKNNQNPTLPCCSGLQQKQLLTEHPLPSTSIPCSLLYLKSHNFSFHWMSYFALSGAELPIFILPNVGLTLSSSVRDCGRHRSPARAHTAAHLRPSTGITGSLPGSVCPALLACGWHMVGIAICFWCTFPAALWAGVVLFLFIFSVPKIDIRT